MAIYSKQIFAFSLNGTLAENGQNVDKETADLIVKLLATKKVAVISGCGFPRFEHQLLSAFGAALSGFANLYLLPASGTKLMMWKGAWCEEYSEHLSSGQKESIMIALNGSLRKIGWKQADKTFGQIIQDRGSQITFSLLGENAPIEAKSVCDPDRSLREKIISDLQPKIPNCDVRIGGMTSIDITKRGVNKGYGIRKLEEFLKVTPDSIVFVGDGIFTGGNDFPVKATGVDCIPVKSVAETKELLKGWVL